MAMRTVPQTLRPNAPWATVVAAALEAGAQPLYVTEDDGTLLGTIRLEDAAALIRDEAVLKDLLVAYDVMRPVADTVGCDDTLDLCLKTLSKQGLSELAVTDDDGKLLGAIARSDILVLYDREVLQRGDAVVGFSRDDHAPLSSTVRLGDRIETVTVSGHLVGRTLRGLDLRARYGVYVHGFKTSPEAPARRPEPEMKLPEGSILLVTGEPDNVREVRDLAMYG
jgi:CBS domain-containing protein